MYTIEFEDEYGVAAFPFERVSRAIEWVLDHYEAQSEAGLTLVVTDDETVRQMNAMHRGVDAPTDILSFPADPLPDEIAEELDEPPYLGDLLIAYPYTVRQAQALGHMLDDELTLLAIHGTLHLLGFDHDNAEHQADMWAAQAEALAAAGVAITVPMFTFSEDSLTGSPGDPLYGKNSQDG